MIPPPIPPSLIPNSSFEDTMCCPSNPNQMNCLGGWQNASTSATPDYYNLCGHSSIGSPFTIPQLPTSNNGNGYVGLGADISGYSEYVGTCLPVPLLANTSYTLSFYMAQANGSLNNTVAFYGAPNCTALPWNGLTCPTSVGGWQLLGSQNVVLGSSGEWQKVTMTISTSITINAISFGIICGSQNGGYYYIDEIVVNKSNTFKVIGAEGAHCTNDIVLNLNADSSSNFQWYQNGIALLGETDSMIDAYTYGVGNYIITFDRNGVCNEASYEVSAEYPTANATIFNDSICAGGSATFLGDTSLSNVLVDNFYYSFDDGSPNISAYNTAKSFSTAGNYNAFFVVESVEGCKDSIALPVSVFDIPDAQVEFTTNGVLYQAAQGDTIVICGIDSVYFNNVSTVLPPSIINAEDWGFGDQTSSSVANPAHIYVTEGIYTVKLTTTSDKGCEDTLSFAIDLRVKPQADFTINAAYCEEEIIDFTNNSSTDLPSSIANFQWDFGDLTQSTQENPQHNYLLAGVYDVQLLTENTNGCQDSITQQVTIHPRPSNNIQISNFCQNETISFIDQSNISSGNITSWNWQFGDGNIANTQNTNHNYAAPGNYLVELITESDQGCRDTLSSLYTISPSPEADFLIENVCESEVMQATNTSSFTGGPLAYDWIFENNVNSTLENPPAVIYNTDGTYQVILTATSNQGCVDSSIQNLTIHPVPEAIINESPQVGCSPFNVTLSHQADNAIDNCIWDLGDGTIRETCGTISHTYNAGIYDLSLTVSYAFGCENSVILTDFIDVEQSPIANFAFSPNNITVNQNQVTFINQSRGAENFSWIFGSDLGTSADENPQFMFPSVAEVYQVNLMATSENGLCSDEITKTIRIFDEVIFYVPNAFTPDGFGTNNIFLPIMTAGYDIYEYELTIYNRWGQLVFLSNDASVGWDGQYGGKSAVIDTYIWQINFTTLLTEEPLTERGTVTLLR